MARDPFANLTDDEVLAKMRRALIFAAMCEPGSAERAMQWMIFDSAKMELDRRMMAHVLARIEREGGR